MKTNHNFVLSEYDQLYLSDTTNVEQKKLDKNTFENLENFILEYSPKDDDSDSLDFFKIGYQKKNRKYIQVKNYVGIIQTKNKVTIEILPKIYKAENDKDTARRILFRMLRTLKNSPFKKFDTADLKTKNINLLEIFIKMFLDEVSYLIKKGIKSNYVLQEENCNFLKGKLKINKQILHNFVHKEKFFVEYDDFISDIPENKIIKYTLSYLSKISQSVSNQRLIREYLFVFDEISPSLNFEADFIKCKSNRNMKAYDLILKWCRIFLKKESFTNYTGNAVAFSLLFPMEKLFESYVTHYLKKSNFYDSLKNQHNKYYLAKEAGEIKKDIFNLRPDLVGERNNEIHILDAKWKIIDANDRKEKYKISQSDFYQLLSYAKIYEKYYDKKDIKLFLIYPKSESFENIKEFMFNDSKNIPLTIIPFDLLDTEKNVAFFRNQK